MRRILANVLSIVGMVLSIGLTLSYKWLDKQGVDKYVSIPDLFLYIPAAALVCGIVAWLVSKTLLLKLGERLLSKICIAVAVACFGYGMVVFHL